MKRSSCREFCSRTCTILVILFCLFLVSACTNYDITTTDGLSNCISDRKDLSKAIPKLKEKISDKELLKLNGDALYAIYMDDSVVAFDRDIITILASIPDEKYLGAYQKAANSEDQKQVQQAAYAARLGKFEDVTKILVSNYSKYTNPETRRIILEVGTAVKSLELAQVATKVLAEDLSDAPIAELRASCNALENNVLASSAETLFEASFHADATGRTIAEDCVKALHNLKRDDVVPVLLDAFQLKNEELNKYVEQHPERLTPEAVRRSSAVSLGKYRAQEAVEPLLDYLEDKEIINPPDVLTFRSRTDAAWAAWGMLVGQTGQETILTLNEIGLEGNTRAGQVLYDMYKWDGAYKRKYERVIEFSGASNIEISLRVNAVRALAENSLISDPMMENIINTLKDESFNSDVGFRPAARASIARDMVTYFGITAKPDQEESVWKKFNEMISNEFKCEERVLANSQKACTNEKEYDFKAVIDRIADVQSCFEMATQCAGGMKCFEGLLACPEDVETKKEKCAPEKNYERIKAVYELGKSGNHDYFAIILNNIQKFDAFGLMFVAKALGTLGTKEDVKSVEEALVKAKREMSAMLYKPVDDYLNSLIIYLNNK